MIFIFYVVLNVRHSRKNTETLHQTFRQQRGSLMPREKLLSCLVANQLTKSTSQDMTNSKSTSQDLMKLTKSTSQDSEASCDASKSCECLALIWEHQPSQHCEQNAHWLNTEVNMLSTVTASHRSFWSGNASTINFIVERRGRLRKT